MIENCHHEKGIHTVCSAGDRTGLPIQLLTIDFIDQVFERDKHFLNSETLLSRSSCVYGCSERDLVGASFSITAISFSTDLGSVISIFRSNVLVAIESLSFLFWKHRNNQIIWSETIIHYIFSWTRSIASLLISIAATLIVGSITGFIPAWAVTDEIIALLFSSEGISSSSYAADER